MLGRFFALSITYAKSCSVCCVAVGMVGEDCDTLERSMTLQSAECAFQFRVSSQNVNEGKDCADNKAA